MITAEKIKKLVDMFEENKDLTSASAGTGFGFLLDGEVPKFEKIGSTRRSPKIVHPMYLYINRWGGKDMEVFFSQKLTPLSVEPNEVGGKANFNYWIQFKGAPVVVKRFLDSSDYQDENSLSTVINEALKEIARVYFMCCTEHKG